MPQRPSPRATGGGAHGVLITAPSLNAFTEGLGMTRRRGTCVLAEALAFAATGKVKADIELQALAAINDVFTRLEHGDVPSRVVLDFGGH